jgi:hypothetical protein
MISNFGRPPRISKKSIPPLDFEGLLFGGIAIFWFSVGCFLPILVCSVTFYVLTLSPPFVTEKYGPRMILGLIVLFLSMLFFKFSFWIARGFTDFRYRRVAITGFLLVLYSGVDITCDNTAMLIFDDRPGSWMTLFVTFFTAGVVIYKYRGGVWTKIRTNTPDIR